MSSSADIASLILAQDDNKREKTVKASKLSSNLFSFLNVISKFCQVTVCRFACFGNDDLLIKKKFSGLSEFQSSLWLNDDCMQSIVNELSSNLRESSNLEAKKEKTHNSI